VDKPHSRSPVCCQNQQDNTAAASHAAVLHKCACLWACVLQPLQALCPLAGGHDDGRRKKTERRHDRSFRLARASKKTQRAGLRAASSTCVCTVRCKRCLSVVDGLLYVALCDLNETCLRLFFVAAGGLKNRSEPAHVALFLVWPDL
jgi:hypothetical protein